MAKIKPFKAILPTRDKVHLVATRSYITYNHESLSDKLNNNPYTFLHVINPDHELEKDADRKDKYLAVRDKFEEFVNRGIFHQCDNDYYYIYQQIKNGHLFTGIVAGASIDDYYNGNIKKHEHTITAREEMFKDYLQATRINAEPVLLTYPDVPEIEEILVSHLSDRPEFDFTSTDEVRHRFWIIDNPNDIKTLSESFENVPNLYIADGHHRSASSALLGHEERGDFEKPTDYFLVYLLPESHMQIFDFNRLVKDLNGLSEMEFVEQIRQHFHVEELGDTLCIPQKLHNLSMYLNGCWYSLHCKEGSFDANDPVKSLDANILSENILAPILNITDLKTDNRVDFKGGLEGMEGLKTAVDSGKYKVAFGLYPVSIEHLKWVADTDNFMPPKSTWIEPKLRSGLVIYPM